MNFDTSFFRLFETTCFPVFVTDINGKVLFKNSCAAKYLHTVRKGSNLFFHMTGGDPDIAKNGKIGLALFPDSFLYSRALIFTLGENREKHLIFAFLTKLQMNDYEDTYSYLAKKFSSDFISFLAFIKAEEYGDADMLAPSRLYTEMADRICFESEDFAGSYLCDMADFLMKIKSRCSRAFSALGYRMDYFATKIFLENRFVSLNVGDFAFSFFMALYAVMRNSADKAISIKADYDALRMSIRITVSSPAAGLADGIYREEEIIPECAAEIKLCDRLPCYARRFSCSVKDGILSATAFLDIYKTDGTGVRSVAEKPSYRGAYAMLSFTRAMLSDFLRNGEKH